MLFFFRTIPQSFAQPRVTRIIRTSFLATNIRHRFVKHLDSINIQSSAFSCRWQIFVSQKISDPQALIFRWFWVRRTTQGINLARTTSPKASKSKAYGLVRIILVTLLTKFSFPLDFSSHLCYNINVNADLAHLVERNLAKVEVAGSIPVIRSRKNPICNADGIFSTKSAVSGRNPLTSDEIAARWNLPCGRRWRRI